MNHKQALGVLHRLYAAYTEVIPYDLWFTPEHEALRTAVSQAFSVLAPAILGPIPRGYAPLCDFCHEAYESHLIEVPGKDNFIFHRFCCASCLPTLLTQGCVVGIDGEPVAS